MNLESDLEGISAANPDPNGRGGSCAEMVDQGRGDDAGAAGQGFILHAPLVGADGQRPSSQNLDEIGIRPGWGKALVLAKGAA
jgi:hypothetical protein